jgi:hypothetical protein
MAKGKNILIYRKKTYRMFRENGLLCACVKRRQDQECKLKEARLLGGMNDGQWIYQISAEDKMDGGN